VGTYSNLKEIIKGMHEWSYEDMEGCEPKAINESLSHVMGVNKLIQDVLGCLVITTFSLAISMCISSCLIFNLCVRA